MKNGIILARKSTSRGELDLSYLDETSRRKISSRRQEKPSFEIGKKLKEFAEYASKESFGQVHAGGLFHDLIRINPDGTSTAPSKLSNEERKQRLSDAWFHHIRKFPSSTRKPVIQHKMVFSMSTEFHNQLVAAGLNPDRVLHSTMKKIMGKFAAKFHPTDSIGYAYGIHHDTDNVHVHVALCPRSAKGDYVGCSTSRSKTSGHKDQMGAIRMWLEKENEQWTEVFRSPQKLQEHVSKRLDSDKLVAFRRLNHVELDALRNTQNQEAYQLHQLYGNIRNIESAIAAQRLALAGQRGTRFVSHLFGHRPSKTARAADKLVRNTQRLSIRHMQQQLLALKKKYRSLHKRYTRLYGFSSYGHHVTPQQTIRQQRHVL